MPENCGSENYEIRGKLFYQNTAITSVNIPSMVTSIGASCFSDCSSLEYVIIGNGITHIGNSAFPASLEKFYYKSNKSEWAKINYTPVPSKLGIKLWSADSNSCVKPFLIPSFSA